jgi:hypothetical protein
MIPRYFSRALCVSVVAATLGSSGLAQADDCATMLQPYFLRMNSAPERALSGVELTYTRHISWSGSSPTVDTAAAPLPDLMSYGHSDQWHNGLLSSTLFSAITTIRTNTSTTPFALSATGDFKFEISSTGVVSVVQRVNGTNVGGLPPTVFQGTCEGGFIFGHTSNVSHVITLKMLPYIIQPA